MTLFDQGLTQVLQAAVTGLEPSRPYVLALAQRPDGSGALEPLASFKTDPAGAQVVNAVGPIKQVVRAEHAPIRQYLVIVPGSRERMGRPVQLQTR